MTKDDLSRRRFIRNSSLVAGGAIASGLAGQGNSASAASTSKILCYNPDMEYRRLGKTELMVSAVCLGGHWKRYDVMNQDFDENRKAVVDRCMEVGINHIDACTYREVMAYCKALKGRRDKMTMALSHCAQEVRKEEYRTSEKLLGSLDETLRDSGQEYTDLWRITCLEPGGKHTFNTSCEIVDALEKAKKQGKTRFIGMSSHDRRWHKMMIEHFPQIDVVLFPYTAMSKRAPTDSLFDALKKCDVGSFGIKPFASNSLFKGDSSPDSPHAAEDNRRARLALRYILANDAVTAPIPGLVSPAQVDNVARAVKERRELDAKEKAELAEASERAWANLPANYQWLKDWQYV